MSAPRTVAFHALASVKGGVGKSTLAAALAKCLAARGSVPVLIDCDMLGTSLADGLRLCAPAKVLLADGAAVPAPGTVSRFHSPEETARLRRVRRDRPEQGRFYPVYLNDLLDLKAQTHWIDWAWRHLSDDKVRYFPSSSIFADVASSWHWLYEEPFDWICKLAWIVDTMIDALPGLTDIIFDLPPGVVGFSHEVFVMLSFLSTGQALPSGYPSWPRPDVAMTTRPYVVASTDRNDLLPALELWGHHLERLPSLIPLVNRDTGGLASVLGKARDALGSIALWAGIEQAIQVVPYREELAAIFDAGDVKPGPALDAVARAFRLEVA